MTTKTQAAHDAIDRLVADLERQANEHVHALDALRAENEALRTQNERLRRSLAETQDGMGGIGHMTQTIADLNGEVARLRHLVEESRKVHEMNAADAKPVREVVRGTYDGRPGIAQPGHKPGGGCGRTAIGWEDGC